MLNISYIALKFIISGIAFTLLILICLIVFFLLIPAKYLLSIKMANEKEIHFRLSFFCGLVPLKLKYKNKKLQIKLLCFDLDRKLNRELATKNNVDSDENSSSDQKKSAHNQNNFSKTKQTIIRFISFIKNDFKNLLPPTLEFLLDIAKKLRPKKLILDGQLGFDDPAVTGYVCAAEKFLFSNPHKKNFVSNIKYDFNNQSCLINFFLHGSICPIFFILTVVKYIRSQFVYPFLKNNFFSSEVH